MIAYIIANVVGRFIAVNVDRNGVVGFMGINLIPPVHIHIQLMGTEPRVGCGKLF